MGKEKSVPPYHFLAFSLTAVKSNKNQGLEETQDHLV